MKNFEKIRTYKEIKGITLTGTKHTLRPFIVYEIAAEQNKKLRIGILLSRKFGNAVARNFARRRLVAALSLIETGPAKNKNLVFIPRSQISKMKFENIIKELKKVVF